MVDRKIYKGACVSNYMIKYKDLSVPLKIAVVAAWVYVVDVALWIIW